MIKGRKPYFSGKNMRKKLIVAMMAGVLSAGIFSTGVFAADTDLKGEVNTFIAASLSNAMEEIQKDFNETYPDVEILYNAAINFFLIFLPPFI